MLENLSMRLIAYKGSIIQIFLRVQRLQEALVFFNFVDPRLHIDSYSFQAVS
jgi:hypothetical protein